MVRERMRVGVARWRLSKYCPSRPLDRSHIGKRNQNSASCSGGESRWVLPEEISPHEHQRAENSWAKSAASTSEPRPSQNRPTAKEIRPTSAQLRYALVHKESLVNARDLGSKIKFMLWREEKRKDVRHGGEHRVPRDAPHVTVINEGVS